MKSLFYVFLLSALTLSAAGLRITNTGREVMVRNEANGALELTLVSRKGTKMTGLVLKAKMPSGKEAVCKVPDLDAHGRTVVRFPVETNLAVGDYSLEVTYEADCGSEKISGTVPVQYGVGPLIHDRMTSVIWDEGKLTDIMDCGFTHSLGFLCWGYANRKNVTTNPKFGDQYLRAGHRRYEKSHLPKALEKKYPRIGRDGKPRPEVCIGMADAGDPRLRKEWAEFFEKPLAPIKNHPAYDGFNIFSEKADGSQPTFAEYSKKAFREYAGFDIPQEVQNYEMPPWPSIKGFPFSRVVPENHQLLVYYRWFWKIGKGWPVLVTDTHRQIKKAFDHPVETCFEPAVRVPPVWGCGGESDYLCHWTYAYPDPIRVSVNTSELLAMASEKPGWTVRNGVQIIAYRRDTAPKGVKCANPPAWLKKEPNAAFITVAPDLMRIASWMQFSRYVSGMVFHGLNSLIDMNDPKHGYRFTNSETKGVLKDFLVNVMDPLGPALMRIPERPSEVAVLESYASSCFARRATWGEGCWIFDASMMLHWANMLPSVMYEEQIAKYGLGSVKVLVLPHCDVLTETVYRRILEFQEKGGIVVADNSHVPGLMPDVSISVINRTGKPDKDKADLQKAGLDLRKQLAAHYEPYASASNPDLVTWVRSSGDADYFFVINDKRTFGDYFGQYGLVMEKSLPNKGTVSLNRTSGAVYDLVSHKEVPFRSENGKTVLDMDFAAKDGGHVFLVLPEKLGAPVVKCPAKVRKGEAFNLMITPKFASGKTVASVHPVSIRVTDANGKSTDDTVPGAASEKGVCSHRITVPLNGASGTWTALVKDLASGAETTVRFTVE